MPLAGNPKPGQYAAVSDLTDFFVGPHCLFARNGIVLNDNAQLERYDVEDMTGFGPPPRNVNSTQNVQQNGSLSETTFYGERTMTLTGNVIAGSIQQLMRMTKALETSTLNLGELPLRIYTKSPGTFKQPAVRIFCKVGDIEVARKIEQQDQMGMFRRAFTIALRASDPTYKEEIPQSALIVPTSVTARGRSYPKRYSYQYNVPMDGQQNAVATSGNSVVVQNTGNWMSQPKFVFTGPMGMSTLVNEESGQKIVMKPIGANQVITVDTYAGTVTDQDGLNAAYLMDSSSDWMWFNGIVDGRTGVTRLSLYVDSYSAGAQVAMTWVNTHIS